MLKFLDLTLLSLMIVSLPAFEVPKNIFLVGFVITRILIELSQPNQNIKWTHWDSIFLSIIVTALLSTIFAGMPHLEEWKGFRALLKVILIGWLLSRAKYKAKDYAFIFKLIIISTLLPLIFGLYQCLIMHPNSYLQLHSVGHVNHSAIYLVMIFGASLGWFLSGLNQNRKKISPIKFHSFWTGILSFILFLSLIIGQSRGAFAAGIVLSLLIIFLVSNNKKIKLLGSLVLVTLILLTIFFKTGIIQKQITNQENNNTLAFRDKVWNVSFESSNISPLLGIGMSNWHFITLEQLKNSVEKRGGQFNPDNYFFPGHAHSLYLSALVERGIVGLMVTFIFMGLWIKHLIETYRWARKKSFSISLWVGSLSAWIATFGIGLVNTTFHHENAILACLFLGLYLSYTNTFLLTSKYYKKIMVEKK